MPLIKNYAPFQNLTNFKTFVFDEDINSQYFKITEFSDTLTGGKNAFLIEGSDFLKSSTEVKIEILDVDGNPIYYEVSDGTPEYYEGTSKLISIHIYPDTPIGVGSITILAELSTYVDEFGAIIPIPSEWISTYNIKWQRSVKINRNLANETAVRFFRRPVVSILEIPKPIFTKNIPIITQSGSITGIPELPTADTDISNWRSGTLYRLRINDNQTHWSSSILGNSISIPELNYSANVVEVLNDTNVLVDTPHTTNNIVQPIDSAEYITTFEYLEGQTISESALTGSFAKIDVSNLKTFVGDVARLKIFRKSKSDVGDFTLVQESKLESTELLRDIETPIDTEIPYGNFTDSVLSDYWVSSSTDHPISLNLDILEKSVKVDFDESANSVQKLITSSSISISNNVEYTLSFKTLLSGSVDSGKYLKAYFSSSEFEEQIVELTPDLTYRNRQNISKNIITNNSGDVNLVFEFSGGDWYISNISLRNSQDTSFSPDEFTLIQEIPRKLDLETFDFRFEFYDINNNFIPVNVTATQTFTGGNTNDTSTKFLSLNIDPPTFKFLAATSNIPDPTNQIADLSVSYNQLVGPVTYTSAAFDGDGELLLDSDYIGGQYPGLLTNITDDGAYLTISNFTGSRDDIIVSSITYTVEKDGLISPPATISRLNGGANGLTSPPFTPIRIETENKGYSLSEVDQSVSGSSISIGLATFNRLVIGDDNYALWDTGGDSIISTNQSIDWDSIGYIGFSSKLVLNNVFETPVNRYVRDYTKLGDFILIYVDTENYGVYTVTEKTKVSSNFDALQADLFGDVSVKINFEWGAGAFGPYSNPNNAIPEYIGFLREIVSPGLTYRGEWSSSEVYYYTESRRDIVLGLNGTYYLANNRAKSGQSGWEDPLSDNQTDWIEFGAQFSSVATDILFAQDVYANRTINIGTSGNNPVIALNADYPTYDNPYISISGSGYGLNGIWMGFEGGPSNPTAKLSLVSPDGNYLKWNGSDLELSGTVYAEDGIFSGSIQANSGYIGGLNGWVIQDGIIHDQNSTMFLDSGLGRIEVKSNNNTSLVIKRGEFSDLSTNSVNITLPSQIFSDNGLPIKINPDNINDYVYNRKKIYHTTGGNGIQISLPNTGTYKTINLQLPFNGFLDGTDPNTEYGSLQANVTMTHGYDFFTTNNPNGIPVKSFEVSSTTISPILITPYATSINTFNPVIELEGNSTYYVYSWIRISGNITSGQIQAYYDGSNFITNTFSLENNIIELTADGIQISSGLNKYFRARRDISDTIPVVETKGNITFSTNGNSTPIITIDNSQNTSGLTRALNIVNGGLNATRQSTFSDTVYFNSNSFTGRMAIGEINEETTLIGQDFPNSSTNYSNARLRPGTRLGISGRYLIWDSSTIRIKKDIEDYPEDAAYQSIKNLKPVLYWPLDRIDGNAIENYDESYEGIENPTEYIGKQGGFIAEWLDQDPNLRKYVTYNTKGEVDGIAYDKLVVPAISAMQKLMKKVEELEDEIGILKSTNSGSFNS